MVRRRPTNYPRRRKHSRSLMYRLCSMHDLDFQSPCMLIQFDGVTQEAPVIRCVGNLPGQCAGATGEASQSFGVEQQLASHRWSGSGRGRCSRPACKYPACTAAPGTWVRGVARGVRPGLAGRAFDPVAWPKGGPQDAAAKAGRDPVPAGGVDSLGLRGARSALAAAGDRARKGNHRRGGHSALTPGR